MADLILAYDFGTSGVKAALVDYQGTLLGHIECGYPLISEKTGWAEQDPTDYWNAVCKATRSVMEKVGAAPGDVKGTSFSTQGMGIIPVDEDGNTLYNNITWVDSRAREQANKINAKLGADVIDASDAIPKVLWFVENEPELYAKTKYFLDCTGYLNFKATGVMASDYTQSTLPISPDPKKQAFKRSLIDAAGIPADKFAPLIPCTGYVGNLTEKAAEELGLTTEAKVYMGAVDVTSAAVGAGCGKVGDAHVYLGTSGWISVITGEDRPTKLSTGIYQLVGMEAGKWIYGGCVQSACLALNWTVDQFYHLENEMMKGNVHDFVKGNIYDLVNKELEDIPAGSNGLMATPWLMGERCPIMDEKAKVVFMNASNLHDRRHFVNAMMESICYSLRMQVDYYENDSGKRPAKMSSIGGGSLSDHWMQMMANVMNMPVWRPKNCRHSGAIGAAAFACVGMGLYTAEEVDKFIQVEKTFYPEPEAVATYDHYYKLWKKIHPALQDLFAELSETQL